MLISDTANPMNVSIALVRYDRFFKSPWQKVASVMDSMSEPWSVVLSKVGFVVLTHALAK